MKIHSYLQFWGTRAKQLGMTLPEVMITSAIFTMAMAGFLALHIFALRYDQTVKLKLIASNDARNTINRLAADIRSAGRVRVGNADGNQFQEAAFGEPQIGNALQIYPDKSNTNDTILYYCDDQDELLKRSAQGETEVVLARSVTNVMVFSSEDGYGRVLSNNFNNRVIGISMQFYQDHSAGSSSPNGMLYDYYQIHSKVTRRALE